MVAGRPEIAFSRFAIVRLGVFQLGIYVIDVDGKNGRWLRRGFESEQLSWSPDGTQLAYKDVTSESIFRINSDGTEKRRLAAGEAPSWSPDGRHIAFSREQTIWTMKSDGSSQRKAWPHFCNCGYPDWIRQ